MVAAAIALFVEGDSFLEANAFVSPSGLATHRNNKLPGVEESKDDPQNHKLVWTPLHSFKFIKGETSYGDVLEGNVASGMLGGTPSIGGFGGSSMSGGNSLNRMRRNRRENMWWSRFSQNTPTTLLAVGSLESWPVMEADDIQVLVKKGDDPEDKDHVSNPSNKSVKATLERWERDIGLEVIGRDGYPMLGNQMQPGGQYNGYNDGSDNGRCTQSIKFDVKNGDVYPFSGTISVPPPLAVEDSMGNQKTVMMVLNNPDEEEGTTLGGQFMRQPQYDEYGNELPPSKPSAVAAKLEPLYKSPDEKYAEAQKQQQLQYDEWGNEVYNPQQQEQKATISSNGYQSFQLDASDPASNKIKISLDREGGGGGFGGFGGGGNSATEARVEIFHGFRDQYGNPYSSNYGDEEEDKRISFEVSTMHPTFSTVLDTMPASLLAKHSLPSNDMNFLTPYLEVRIANTGGASLQAGVESVSKQYKSQTQKQRQQQRYEKQKYSQRVSNAMALNTASSVRADNPFLLTDSAQSSTASRRMKDTIGMGVGQKSYVRANNSFSGRRNTAQINEMFTVDPSRSSSYRNNGFNNYNEDQGMARPSYDRYSMNGSFGMQAQANNPEDVLRPMESETNGYTSNRVMASRRNNRATDYYGYDAIDTVATSNFGTSGLVANNDFTKANGSKTSAIVPGSGNFRGFSPLQSFGGNSGRASGMQQPFQGRSFGNNNGGSSMFQSSRRQSYDDDYGGASFDNGGASMFEDDSYGREGMQPRQSLQQAFSNLTSPRKTKTVKGSRGTNWTQNKPGSAFAGNGNVIGNGVISGRPAPNSNRVGNSNRMMPNSQSLGGNGRYRSNSRNNGMNDDFIDAQSSSFESSFTPPPSNNFGGRNNGGSFGQGNSNNFMGGSMKQQLEENDSFSRDFGNNRNGGRMNNNRFGGNSNNNSFGGNSGMNNNAGGFGGSNNSGSPFGNLGSPPQTRGNSKNPFAVLNGEATEQEDNGFGGYDDSFGTDGGFGASQRPLSPPPVKNPFAGLNGRTNNQYSGGSTTAMRSSSLDYGTTDDENPIVGFAKNVVKGIKELGQR